MTEQHVLDSAVASGRQWLHELMTKLELPPEEAGRGLHALRAGLHAIRDRLPAVVLLAIAGIAGCEAIAERDPKSLADRVAAVHERMHERFTAASAMQQAIGFGDLDRARAEARRLATQDEPGVLPEWRPYLENIRSAAGRVAASSDTVTAAKTMAQLGRACARCHEATDAKIQLARELAPAGDTMTSHQWAAARMWEGLIASSDDRWLAGARTLAGARLTLTAEGGELGIADDAARSKLLAARAVKLGDRDERATLYGELLATCAHCHASIRDRVLRPPSVTVAP